MGALMLLHVIFTGKRFVASRAENVFLACMFFPVTSSMTRRRKCVVTGIAGSMRTRVFFFHGF